MSKHQTRRTILMRGALYQRLHAFCEARGRAMADLVEELVEQHLGHVPAAAATAAPAGDPVPAPPTRASSSESTSTAAPAVEVRVGQRWTPRGDGWARRRVDVEVIRLRRHGDIVSVRLCTPSRAYQAWHIDVLRQQYRPVEPTPALPPAAPASAAAPALGRSVTLPSGVVVHWPADAPAPPAPPVPAAAGRVPALTPHVLVDAPLTPAPPLDPAPPLVAIAPIAPIEAARAARADVTECPRFDPRTMDRPQNARAICKPRLGGTLELG